MNCTVSAASTRWSPATRRLSPGRALADTVAAKNPDVMRRLKHSINGSSRRDLEISYRQELSYTYELNMMGRGDEARADFIDDRRTSYLARESGVKGE